MNTAEHVNQPRMLTLTELAMLAKVFREIRKWSQEQLGAISGLSTRTIQRIEEGKPSSLDTRRALARAFEFEDIDALNKPYTIQTDAEVAVAKEKFDKENITLQAEHVTTGRRFANLVVEASMDISAPAFELPEEAEEQFAELTDYFREYRDCADLYSERDRLDVYAEFQQRIDALSEVGVSICCATRKVAFKGESTREPWSTTALHVIACQRGKELSKFATARAVRIG